jgi:hypothetical protein
MMQRGTGPISLRHDDAKELVNFVRVLRKDVLEWLKKNHPNADDLPRTGSPMRDVANTRNFLSDISAEESNQEVRKNYTGLLNSADFNPQFTCHLQSASPLELAKVAKRAFNSRPCRRTTSTSPSTLNFQLSTR